MGRGHNNNNTPTDSAHAEVTPQPLFVVMELIFIVSINLIIGEISLAEPPSLLYISALLSSVKGFKIFL